MDFPSFSSLVSQTWGVYKSNFKKLLRLCLLPYLTGLVLVAEALLIAVLFFVLKLAFGGVAATLVAIVLAIIVVVVTVIVLGSWVSAASIFFISNLVENKFIGVREALGKTKPLILAVWWVGFLSMLVSFSGLMLFIVPGIIFGVWLSLVTWVVLLDGVVGFSALKLSREYLRGYTLKVFLYGIAFSFLMGLLSSLPSAIFRNSNLGSITGIYSFIVSFLAYPISFIFTYFIYKFLKSAKPKALETAESKPTGLYKAGALIGLILPVVFVLIFFAVVLPKLITINKLMQEIPTVPVQQQNVDIGAV